MSYSIQTDSFGNRWIRCLRCGLGSYNRNDIVYEYCGHCHVFHEDQAVREWLEAQEKLEAGAQ